MAAGDDELTIYVGHAGEKYSDPDDWRELIVEGRLEASSLVPVRRAGALQHRRAYDLPELKPLFDELGVAPSTAASSPSPRPEEPEPAAPPIRPPESPPRAPPPPSLQILTRGANAPVATDRLYVRLSWTSPPPGVEVDGCAYLLGPAGQVRSDADMIFYNQTTVEQNAVQLLSAGPAGAVFQVDLARLPNQVARVVFCAAVTAGSADASFGRLHPVVDAGAQADSPTLRHLLELEDGREAAVIFCELYRRNEAWRFRAVSQGFHGGLAPLARSYGVVVQD